MQEKEEKLVRLYENQQQRAFDRVSRGSAGSNGTITTTIHTGKVRQMFDERRQKAGIDKSYPLEPLKQPRPNGYPRNPDLNKNKVIIKTTVQKSITHVKNGKPIINKKQAIQGIYKNDCGEETYEEERYENNNGNETFRHDTERDLVALINGHNLESNLDDEEMPSLSSDGVDAFTGKLTNVGGKPPSQSVGAKKLEVKTVPKVNGAAIAAKRPPVHKKEATVGISNNLDFTCVHGQLTYTPFLY